MYKIEVPSILIVVWRVACPRARPFSRLLAHARLTNQTEMTSRGIFYYVNYPCSIYTSVISLLTLLLCMMGNTALVSMLIAEEVSTLFRGTSLTTTLMDQYMKMVAIPYLQKTIGDVVAKILECKQSCEV